MISYLLHPLGAGPSGTGVFPKLAGTPFPFGAGGFASGFFGAVGASGFFGAVGASGLFGAVGASCACTVIPAAKAAIRMLTFMVSEVKVREIYFDMSISRYHDGISIVDKFNWRIACWRIPVLVVPITAY
jgi:hypothetical protein